MSIIKDNALQYMYHMPDVIKEFIEIKALGNSIDIEMTKYYDAVDAMIDNQFISSMDDSAVRRWEKIMQLTSPIGSDLASRRQAIESAFLSQPPINVDALRMIIESFIGVGVTITIHKENPYVIKCTYRGVKNLPDTTPLFKRIYDSIPANMQVILSYAFITWSEIKSSTWNQIKTKTWHEVLYGLEE